MSKVQFSFGEESIGGYQMLKKSQLQTTLLSREIPLDLSSILLVEANPELRDSRRLLLSTLQHPVFAVSAYIDVCKLPADSNCCLIAIAISTNEHEAERIAGYARRTWPNAKILLLGCPCKQFDDLLYDDAVNPSFNPSGVVERADRLLRQHGRLS
jgi:hypothetical protein